jgi:hypothetical protein
MCGKLTDNSKDTDETKTYRSETAIRRPHADPTQNKMALAPGNFQASSVAEVAWRRRHTV